MIVMPVFLSSGLHLDGKPSAKQQSSALSLFWSLQFPLPSSVGTLLNAIYTGIKLTPGPFQNEYVEKGTGFISYLPIIWAEGEYYTKGLELG